MYFEKKCCCNYLCTEEKKLAKAKLKVVELVNARYTSQICSNCGAIVPKTFAQRVHRCPECGLETDRDINAAIDIMNRSTLGQRGRACEVGRLPGP